MPSNLFSQVLNVAAGLYMYDRLCRSETSSGYMLPQQLLVLHRYWVCELQEALVASDERRARICGLYLSA